MHKYARCAELVPEVFGISASNLSKRFKKSTSESMRRLKKRSLSLYDLVCIIIDGKRYAKDDLLAVLEVTITGEKVILDIGLQRSAKQGRLFAVVKGLVDGGVEISFKNECLPSEERIKSNENIGNLVDKIKENIK